jgi:hypothetical protein
LYLNLVVLKPRKQVANMLTKSKEKRNFHICLPNEKYEFVRPGFPLLDGRDDI